MAQIHKKVQIKITDNNEVSLQTYNILQRGWTVSRIETALKEMFNSTKIDYQKKYDELYQEFLVINGQFGFEKISHSLAKKRCESLAKRLEEMENKLIESERGCEIYSQANFDLNINLGKLQNKLIESETLTELCKKLNSNLLKENELLKGEKSNYIEFNIQLQKNLEKQKEISKSNSESWDEMYQKLYTRKTIKQQFYSASNFIWLLSIASAIIGLFMPVFIPWLKASISLMGLSYIAQNKSFINLFYKK